MRQINGHGIYGAAVFFALHHDGSTRQQKKFVALLNAVPDGLCGLQVRDMPEAKRVYVALCRRNNILPEAWYE